MAASQISLQHLRTNTATKLPDGLKPGQICFNTANKWLMVGIGGDDVLVQGKPVAAGSRVIFGVANAVVPAKIATARPAVAPVAGSMYKGEGFEIFALEGGGLASGATLPLAANSVNGDLFVQVPAGGGAPSLMIFNGTAWVPPINPPKVFSVTQAEVTAAAGSDVTAKAVAVLVAKPGSGVTAKGDLKSGDTLIVTGTGADAGSYIYDGTSFIETAGALPAATAPGPAGTGAVKGIVQLARDTDITETGDATATTGNEGGVVTAKQMRGLADQIAGLITGSTLLGTYDASTSAVASLTAAATAGGRGGLTVGGKLSAGTALHEGDFFVVAKAGTVAGDHASINGALNANDHLVYVGGTAVWRVINSGLIASAVSLHGCSDVSDTAVAAVLPANAKGLLVRDSSVAADGAPAAYKLVNVIDLGEF
jgi:hypothetical protein